MSAQEVLGDIHLGHPDKLVFALLEELHVATGSSAAAVPAAHAAEAPQLAQHEQDICSCTGSVSETELLEEQDHVPQQLVTRLCDQLTALQVLQPCEEQRQQQQGHKDLAMLNILLKR
jgi:hypothetical protein